MIQREPFNKTLKNATKVWVDPPSGWLYGFPKIWNKQDKYLEDLLRESNYPEKDIPFAVSYMRMWLVDEDNK